MSTVTQPRPVDYRALMHKVEQVVETIVHTDELDDTVLSLAQGIVAELGDELGIEGGRLYKRQGEDYVLHSTFGKTKKLPRGLRVQRSYPPVATCCAQGTIYMTADDPLVDRALEDELGVREFAAIEVGDDAYILAFNTSSPRKHDDILFSLGLLRHSINQQIRQGRLEDVFRQARKIQSSILPRQVPVYGEYDIFGHTESMETVGGDFYDFIPLSDKILGIAIADVSGHGLPAALQVRDVYTGLRMGMARDFKIVRTVERLNEIIHRSTLTSRFVSMFYGELELNGLFIYVNAGHPPPFHLAVDGSVRQLEQGGLVLGPLPDSTYERGFVTLRPGDMLVLYTDGIVETTCNAAGRGEEYGSHRLLEVARENQGRTAAEVVEAVFADVNRFCGSCPAGDDRTVVVVTHPEHGDD